MNYDKQCHAMEGEPQHRQGPMYYDATRSQEHSELVVEYIDPFLQIQPAMSHDTPEEAAAGMPGHRSAHAMPGATARRAAGRPATNLA